MMDPRKYSLTVSPVTYKCQHVNNGNIYQHGQDINGIKSTMASKVDEMVQEILAHVWIFKVRMTIGQTVKKRAMMTDGWTND